MKNKLNKVKEIAYYALTGLGSMAMPFGICFFNGAAITVDLVIFSLIMGVPFTFVMEFFTYDFIDGYKNKKKEEAIKYYQDQKYKFSWFKKETYKFEYIFGENRSFVEIYKHHRDYAIKRVNNIQPIKNQCNEVIYAEGLIEVDDEELDRISKYSDYLGVEKIIEEYKKVKNKLQDYYDKMSAEVIKDVPENIKNNSINTELLEDNNILKETRKLEELKQKLTRLSFLVQDIATDHNMFLAEESPKEIYENKEEIKKLKVIKPWNELMNDLNIKQNNNSRQI